MPNLNLSITMLARFQLLIVGCLFALSSSAYSVTDTSADPLVFADEPLAEATVLPDWFKLSFLDLKDSLKEAKQTGKRGLLIYFHRQDCAYCNAQLEVNWGSKDIVNYTRKHFDVIAIDVRGARTVTDFDGTTATEKSYAARMQTNFTPSFLFYDTSGKLALRLPGFRPPYQFRAALEYVADQHYLRTSFADYLAGAEAALSFGQEELNENDAFIPAPYNFDRSRIASKRPLLVFFEHTRCHACDLLHAGPMSNAVVTKQLADLDVAQLDIYADIPVITPDGKKTTSRAWARQLELNFAPTLIFFDEHGKEIIRVESIVRLYRLNKVLTYIRDQGYKKYPTLQLWQQSQKH